MNDTAHRVVIVSLFTIASLGSTALAQEREHARAIGALPEAERAEFSAQLTQAQGRFEQGDFSRAIEALERAYAIYPLPRILYKIAEASERDGQFERAIESYERYLAEDPDTQDRATVQGVIANLRQRLSEPALLIISTEPQGALVTLDRGEAPIGATPLRYPIEPGDHTVLIEEQGYRPLTLPITASPGAEIQIDRRLEPLPLAMSESSPKARRFGGLGAALGVGAGGAFLLARRQGRALDESYGERDAERRPDDLEPMTKRHNALVVGGWALAALSAASSTMSLLSWKSDSRSAKLQGAATSERALIHLEVLF